MVSWDHFQKVSSQSLKSIPVRNVGSHVLKIVHNEDIGAVFQHAVIVLSEFLKFKTVLVAYSHICLYDPSCFFYYAVCVILMSG